MIFLSITRYSFSMRKKVLVLRVKGIFVNKVYMKAKMDECDDNVFS